MQIQVNLGNSEFFSWKLYLCYSSKCSEQSSSKEIYKYLTVGNPSHENKMGCKIPVVSLLHKCAVGNNLEISAMKVEGNVWLIISPRGTRVLKRVPGTLN